MSGRATGTRRAATAGGVEKPWASGRVLTPEQRARKQEADRKANRFLKKEVQDRLTLLEARVLELEKTAPLSNHDSAVEVYGSSKQCYSDSVPAASSPAAHTDVIPNYGKDIAWNAIVPYPNASTISENNRGDVLTSPAEDGSAQSYLPNTRAQAAVNTSLTNVHADELPTELAALGSTVSPDFTDVTTTARTRPDGRHMTCFLNNLVNYIRSMAPGIVCFDDQYNQDLIVAAVMKGWEQTLPRYQQRCPLWEVLRLVDTYLFKDCSFVERISVLRMLHKRYLYEVNANLPTVGPPPPWFRPQFSEKVFFHDPVIDHLTWPRLRQRLIASEQDRMTNKFWALFVKNLRVTWRYEPIDIMTFNPDTQLYQLTPVFESAIMDMTNWRMDMEFFRGIPQLAGDVPPYNYMPLQTVTPRLGPNGARQPLSPRFGVEQGEQSVQQIGQVPQDQRNQQSPEAVQEGAWMQHPQVHSAPIFPEQLGAIKMSPGVWDNLYS